MPIVDPNDPQLWVDQYASYIHHPTDRLAPRIQVGYTRARFLAPRKARGRNLVRLLGMLDGQNILIIGAGFCWTGEGIQEALPGATVIGIDTSTWVQDNKALDETAEIRAAVVAAGLDPDVPPGSEYVAAHRGAARSTITVLNEDSLTTGSKNAIRRDGFGDSKAVIDWAITEDVLPWLTDAEIAAAAPHWREMGTNIAHVVTPFLPEKAGPDEPPPIWNWKTKAAWELLLTPDVIVTTQECG